jgi:tetratricopeptide (TPR) repeat protein
VYERALELARQGGDVRTQVRCRTYLGLALQTAGRMDEARESLITAIAVARAAGMADLWAAAALTLGLNFRKVGNLDRASELFSEALGLSSSLKNTRYQLQALFNMAHTERERGASNRAREYFESTAALAQRVGQSDLEIGARAGEGMCLLALGRPDDARRSLADVERLMASRAGEWFQGRELVEALRVLVAAADKHHAEVVTMYEAARSLGEPTDLFSVAWLTAECAPALAAVSTDVAQKAIARYARQAETLGFSALVERFGALRP